MKLRKSIAILTATAAVGIGLGLGLVITRPEPASASRPFATSTLRSADGTKLGHVWMLNHRGSSTTDVIVKLRNFSAADASAFHGFHIHANNDPANGDGCVADPAQPAATWFVSADGHWKKDPASIHGKHSGDLPSPYINADGSAEFTFEVDKLTATEVVGKVLIVHMGPDNFANIPVAGGPNDYTPGATALATTQNTGNAGARLGCGVIN